MKRNKVSLIFNAAIICILLIVSTISVSANELESKQVVNKNKVWKFTFNKEINLENICNDAIYIENSKGDIIHITLELEENKKTLLIEPPVKGYKTDEEYTLFFSTDLEAKVKIKNYLTIDFVVEEDSDEETKEKTKEEREEVKESKKEKQDDSKKNEDNNKVDKAVVAPSKNDTTQETKSKDIKENHWLCGDIEYEISLQDIKTGDEAWEIIKKSNRFNEKPEQDKEYVLAKFNIKLNKTERDRYVDFSCESFEIVSAEGKVYNKYKRSVVLENILEKKIFKGEECSGWIVGYVDKNDNPVIVLNKGKESEVHFNLKNSENKDLSSKKDSDHKEESDENKESKIKKDEKKANSHNNTKNSTKDKLSLTDEELLQYLKNDKETLLKYILFKDLLEEKDYKKLIKENYSELNKKFSSNINIFDLYNKKDNMNSYDDMIMKYLFNSLKKNGN